MQTNLEKYKKEEIEELIDGVEKIMKTIFYFLVI